MLHCGERFTDTVISRGRRAYRSCWVVPTWNWNHCLPVFTPRSYDPWGGGGFAVTCKLNGLACGIWCIANNMTMPSHSSVHNICLPLSHTLPKASPTECHVLKPFTKTIQYMSGLNICPSQRNTIIVATSSNLNKFGISVKLGVFPCIRLKMQKYLRSENI